MNGSKPFSAQITCPECSSSIEIFLNREAQQAECPICQHQVIISVQKDINGILKKCICCGADKFYKQKDFSRKVGVVLFVIAAITSIWTYGISFIVFWLVDMFLFKKLGTIAICYQCSTIYRGVQNLDEIGDFDHLTHDKLAQQ